MEIKINIGRNIDLEVRLLESENFIVLYDTRDFQG